MFHLYGLLIGIAVVVTLLLVEKKLAQHLPLATSQLWWQAVWWVLFGAVIGARGYHVLTDFSLYQQDLVAVFQVWRGGLSIIGAVIGAALGAAGWVYWRKQRQLSGISLAVLADAAAFALPIGQAIGRLGNWVNQELYGLPSDLPWKIFIDPAHRLPGFIQFAFFHPLFAYEAGALLILAALLWCSDRRHQKAPKNHLFGTGHYFAIYVAYYSVVRFSLDFLRIDKSYVGGLPIGKNQVVMICLFLVASCFLLKHMKKIPLLLVPLFFLSTVLLSACQALSPSAGQKLLHAPDHSMQHFQLRGQQLQFEVVNTDQSMAQGLSDRSSIGSDGMLFVFPQLTKPQFWMKGMQFDLDFVWLNNLKVVELTPNVPKAIPGTKFPIYQPGQLSNMVLELPAGDIAKRSIGVGDEFVLESLAK